MELNRCGSGFYENLWDSSDTIYNHAVWKWTALFLLIVTGLCFVALIHRWTQRHLHGHSPVVYLGRVLTPLTLLLIPLVLYAVNRQLTLTGWVSGGVTLLAEAFVYYALAWIVWSGSIAISEAIIASPKVRDRSLDAQVLRLAARTIGIVALAVIVLHISNRLGAPLYSLVAGVGIGGLAIALAVRSSLENILGGLMLFADKPVRIGDFCRFGDDYGTVEDIGMRSTRLRKLDDTLVTIPNAEFAQRDLTNYARVRRRLYNTTLGLRYETSPEQLRYVIADIRSMLLGHPKVSPDQLQVRFHSFGAYSLDIFIFAYVRTRDILNFRAICEDINFRIMDIVQEAGTGFAFPSQTTYIGQDTGLDNERGKAAEMQVRAWRSGGRLPFPEFDAEQIREMEDRLDYPPEGSPDFKSGDSR
ncbi:mechanosensitive ion channel family protein [Seongchinamella sediminis]|uniref:Mechanosensitive ion channel family protein n=1 Tax=Seongchinamella sediminis TaxID=2283635 RepID=A0A3L7DWI7_9GAMM|nr:mechanosensitive ion channel family protein [Seongchinamella sediminis]RLQ20162.1 mechanosensitive ion channel family protein [Seongchinamella sediminis]